MSRIFAIDWDRKEARAVLLQSGPTGTSVAGAWATKLEAPEGAPLSGKQIGAKLAAIIGGEALGKATTIVGVGRDHTQIKLLTLPPAPDDELPELVRFQAEREFTALGSEAALDYIPISGDGETQHLVLAVALSPAGITESREVAQAAGAEVNRITVRALAAVSLVQRSGVIGSNAVTLIANPLSDEADLIVLDQGKVVLLRTVRLPEAEQAAGRQRALVGEIRRTVASARQQSADRPIDQLFICGNSSAVDRVDGLGDELGMTVKVFDPAEHAPSGLSGAGVPAESLARFAAVLGMAQAEVDRRPPIVDFLNVHRKAERRKFGREHMIAAAVAASILLMVGLVMWWQTNSRKSRLADLKTEFKQKEADLKKLKATTDQAAAITLWRGTDVNWLDEMVTIANHIRPKPVPRTVAEKAEFDKKYGPFPEATDVHVKQQIIMGRPAERNTGGGLVQISQAVAKDSAAAGDLTERMFLDDHLGVSPGPGKTVSEAGYTWMMDLKIIVPPPEDPDIPRQPDDPNAKKAAEPAKAATDGKENKDSKPSAEGAAKKETTT